MNDNYRDKKDALLDAKVGIKVDFQDCHPTDRAEGLAEIGRWCDERAKNQAEQNENMGIPERNDTPSMD